MTKARAGTVARAGALALLLAGCAGQTPATISSPPAATSFSTPSPTSTPDPTLVPTTGPTTRPSGAPTGIWTLIDGEMPPGVFYQAGKTTLIMGEHGGAPDIALPASIAVDYRVSGTCSFAISIRATGSSAQDPAARFDRKIVGETVRSTWLVTLDPGSYEVLPGDSNGCTWIVTVRAG